MKTEFMQAWDGLLTKPSSGVMVLGATNRRDELDEAVLRRFALQLEVLFLFLLACPPSRGSQAFVALP